MPSIVSSQYAQTHNNSTEAGHDGHEKQLSMNCCTERLFCDQRKELTFLRCASWLTFQRLCADVKPALLPERRFGKSDHEKFRSSGDRLRLTIFGVMPG
jgi:hypothetical protein